MIPIKIQCGCGQRYSFEVEPVNGAMPWTVACPVCGTDGTAVANAFLSQSLTATAAAPPESGALVPSVPAGSVPRLRTARPTGNDVPGPAIPAAPIPPTPAPMVPRAAAAPVEREWGPGGRGDTWKWWYYVLAGICIGGYSIWQAYDQHRVKPLGELFLAVFCVAIGIWDFQRKRRNRVAG